MTIIEATLGNNKKKSKSACITPDDKRKIVDKVKMLSKDVHIEIFYFLHKINGNYTLNGNGVFFNLNNLDDETLYTLKKMVNFYNKNEKKLKENYLDRYTKNDSEASNEDIENKTITDNKESDSKIISKDESEDESEDESDSEDSGGSEDNEDSEESGDENKECGNKAQLCCEVKEGVSENEESSSNESSEEEN
jgi:hypothetical protein